MLSDVIGSLITSQWPIKRAKEHHNAVPIYFLIKYDHCACLQGFFFILNYVGRM